MKYTRTSSTSYTNLHSNDENIKLSRELLSLSNNTKRFSHNLFN